MTAHSRASVGDEDGVPDEGHCQRDEVIPPGDEVTPPERDEMTAESCRDELIPPRASDLMKGNREARPSLLIAEPVIAESCCFRSDE